MRLAVIADIHGNRLALGAVLADIDFQGVDLTVNLGDLLSGPLDPAATADVLIERDLPTVRGNHERSLLVPRPEDMGPVDRFARSRLSHAHLEWLSMLPATRVIDGTVFLCHGTPRDDMVPWLDDWWQERSTILPDETSVTAAAEGFDFPVLLCGHTHMARSVRLRDGRLIVNPGSVGLQFIHGSPDARYALIERRGSDWLVSLRTVPYDHAAAARQAAANGFSHWSESLDTGWAGPQGLF